MTQLTKILGDMLTEVLYYPIRLGECASRECQQRCGLVHLRRICSYMRGKIFFGVCFSFQKFVLATEFNVLLQPKLKFEVILRSL